MGNYIYIYVCVFVVSLLLFITIVVYYYYCCYYHISIFINKIIVLSCILTIMYLWIINYNVLLLQVVPAQGEAEVVFGFCKTSDIYRTYLTYLRPAPHLV